jgi:hypothetical protein
MTLVAQDGMRIGFPKLIVVFRKRGHPGSRTVDASKQAVASLIQPPRYREVAMLVAD